MGILFGGNGTQVPIYLAPGYSMRFAWWFEGSELGRGAWVAALHPYNMKMVSSPARVVANGINPSTDDLSYYCDIVAERSPDIGSAAAFRIWVSRLG